MPYLHETANTLFDAVEKFAEFCVSNCGYTRIPTTKPNVIIEKGKVRYRFDTSIVKGEYGSFQRDPNTKMFKVFMGYRGGSVECPNYVPVTLNRYTEPFISVDFIGNKHDQAMVLEVSDKVFIHMIIGKVVALDSVSKTNNTFEYVQAMCHTSFSSGGSWNYGEVNAMLPFGAAWSWGSSSVDNAFKTNLVRVFDTNRADDFKRTSGQLHGLSVPTATAGRTFPDKFVHFDPFLEVGQKQMLDRTPNSDTGRTALMPIRMRRIRPELGYRYYLAGEIASVRYLKPTFLEERALLDGEWRVYPMFGRASHPTEQYPFNGYALAYNIKDYP